MTKEFREFMHELTAYIEDTEEMEWDSQCVTALREVYEVTKEREEANALEQST